MLSISSISQIFFVSEGFVFHKKFHDPPFCIFGFLSLSQIQTSKKKNLDPLKAITKDTWMYPNFSCKRSKYWVVKLFKSFRQSQLRSTKLMDFYCSSLKKHSKKLYQWILSDVSTPLISLVWIFFLSMVLRIFFNPHIWLSEFM